MTRDELMEMGEDGEPQWLGTEPADRDDEAHGMQMLGGVIAMAVITAAAIVHMLAGV